MSSLFLLLRDFCARYPGRFVLVLAALFFAGLAGGLGLATFLPLVEVIIETDATERSQFATMTVRALESVGLTPQLGPLLFVIVVAIGVKGAMLLVAMLGAGYTATRIITDLRMELVRSVLAARWSYFAEKPLGAFANALNAEAVRSSQAFFAAFLLVADIFQIAIYTALTFLISWQMALAAVAVSPLLFLAFRSLLGVARQAGRRQTDLERSVLSRITDTLQGIKPIKAMGAESRLEPIIERDMFALSKALRGQVFATQVLATQQETLIVILMCGAIYLVMRLGQGDTSVLVGLTVIFYRTMNQFAFLQKRHQLIEFNQSAYRSLRGMIDEARRASETAGGTASPASEGPVEFRNVRVAYGEKTVLANVSLRLPQKGFVCINGPSGAGKTSLVDLIAGLHRPASGEIMIGEQRLADLHLAEWRRHLGYVPQEMIVFNDTLRNNVILGSHDYVEADIRTAIDRAGLRTVVEQLPDGLETQVGERGVKLSGGQRQRMAIARALIRKPAILILDEVTASLDPVTEQALATTLAAIAEDVLILAITHQTGMLRHADWIMRVHDGKAEIVRSRQGAPTLAATGSPP